jgi:hypothetical protein
MSSAIFVPYCTQNVKGNEILGGVWYKLDPDVFEHPILGLGWQVLNVRLGALFHESKIYGAFLAVLRIRITLMRIHTDPDPQHFFLGC